MKAREQERRFALSLFGRDPCSCPLLSEGLAQRSTDAGRSFAFDLVHQGIDKGAIAVANTVPNNTPNRAVGRIGEKPPERGNVGCPTLGIERPRLELKKAVFVVPENGGGIAVER